MTITFGSIDLGNDVHYNAMTKHNLVLGFATTNYRGNEETLYYVNKNAEMFTSGPQRPSTSFKAQRGWTSIDMIDRNAEFIGHYKV